MMYRTIIFLWLTFALVIFTRTVAFPAHTSKRHNAKTVWLYSTNSIGFVRITGSYVDSQGDKTDENAKLELESLIINGSVVVRIRSVKENSYLCVNSDGNLTVENHGNITTRCLFSEGIDSGYTKFQSQYNTNWFLGFKRSGRLKQPHNTTMSQKAARFLRYFS